MQADDGQAKSSDQVFKPGVLDMRKEHPELNEYEEFTELTDTELRFVWYISNPSSPLCIEGVSASDRRSNILSAITKSYGDHISPKEKRRFMECQFEDKMRKAIRVMGNINPKARTKAKLMMENIFDVYDGIVKDAKQVKKMKPAEKKHYVATLSKITDNLPGVIRVLEQGFGVKPAKKKKKKEEEAGGSEEHGQRIEDIIDLVSSQKE